LADKYNVVYAITNDILAEIITTNGYQTVRISGFVIGYNMESSFLSSQKPTGQSAKADVSTYWRLFNVYRTNELYNYRKQELDSIIDDIRPQAVVIDLFVCTDYWAIAHRKNECKILFFNPMPSTYRVKDYPIVSEGFWNKQHTQSQVSIRPKIKFYDWLRNPKATLVHWAIQQQRKQLQQLAPLATNATVTQIIANVPELLLAPLEFEFDKEIRQPNQHYLGLCMRPHRHDTELDPLFEELWPQIVAQREAGQRLIYCSFGTFYESADATLLRFVTNLIAVLAQLPQVQLVCSVNKYVIETLKAQKLIAPNCVFVTRVPQMQVLAQADVFITHGGFGSIKEAVYYAVPMLVYPLDPKYDQPGNALKVEQHGLGLRGAFAYERPNDLKTKLVRLLTEPAFKDKIAEMSTTISGHYTDQYLDAQLDGCLGHGAFLTMDLQIKNK
jgi:hypothetical protein